MYCLRVGNDNNTNTMKIEQFIESVFPSQKPDELARKARGEHTDEMKAKEAEARKDMMYIMGAMLIVLLALTGIMVSYPPN